MPRKSKKSPIKRRVAAASSSSPEDSSITTTDISDNTTTAAATGTNNMGKVVATDRTVAAVATKAHQLGDYWCIPFRIGSATAVVRYLYAKEHAVRREDPLSPKGRTLFVLNPPLCSESLLAELFQPLGDVQSVRVSTTTAGKKAEAVVGAGAIIATAHVVFRKASTLRAVLQWQPNATTTLPSEGEEKEGETGKGALLLPVLTAPDATSVGLEKYKREYWDARPGADAITAATTAAIANFDDEVAKKAAAELLRAQEEAQDGWTLVQRGTGVPMGSAATEQGQGQALEGGVGGGGGGREGEGGGAKRKPRKRAKKELRNFYEHQKLEAQQNRIAQLRRKFDEDAVRMEHMRGARKFRPY